MIKYKLAPGVIGVTCGRQYLRDKEKVYPETMWPNGKAKELVRRGFLIEVVSDIPVEPESFDLPEESMIKSLPDVEDDTPEEKSPEDTINELIEGKKAKSKRNK